MRRRDSNRRLCTYLQATRPEKEEKGTYDVCYTGDAVLSDIKYVVTTGLDVVDDFVGGLPFGRIVELYGLEDCGKTALAIRTALRAQLGYIYKVVRQNEGPDKLEKLDPNDYDITIVYVDNEGSLEKNFKLSLEGQELLAVDCRCDTMENLFDLVDKTIKHVKKEREETKRDQFLLIVVDTVAGTSSREELTRSWDKEDYPRQPKTLRKGFRVLRNQIARYNVCMLCINQVSDRFDKNYNPYPSNVPYDDDFTAFGGKALKFWASYRIFMFQVSPHYRFSKESFFDDGRLIGIRSVKNRLKPPRREARMVLVYDNTGSGGLHNTLSILETLIYLEYAVVDKNTKKIIFKFKRNGLAPSTFDTKVDLESEDLESDGAEDEEDEKDAKDGKKTRYRDPRISDRREWFEFYTKHKTDLDALYRNAIDKALRIDMNAESVAMANKSDVTPVTPVEEVQEKPKVRTSSKTRSMRQEYLGED